MQETVFLADILQAGGPRGHLLTGKFSTNKTMPIKSYGTTPTLSVSQIIPGIFKATYLVQIFKVDLKCSLRRLRKVILKACFQSGLKMHF